MRRSSLLLLPLFFVWAAALTLNLAWAGDEPAAAPPKPEAAKKEPTTKSPDPLDTMVAELRIEAAKIRGLAWTFDVPGHDILKKEIPAAFREEVDSFMPKEKRERYTRALRRLGLLTDAQDPFELMGSMMAGMAGGFYSPRAKELFVVEGFSGDAARPVLLHELIHALEDQHFDFQSRTLPISMDPDRTFAATCVVEGSAEHARLAYQALHPDITAAFMASNSDGKSAAAQMRIMQTVPAFMIVPTMLHYRHGPRLVARALKEARDDDYAAVMKRLYADPPVSTEQVLHLDRWFTKTRDYPRGILWAGDLTEALGRGWEKLFEQRQGELDLALYLDRFLGGTNGLLNVRNFVQAVPACAVARKAAAGWDGGRMAFFAKEGAPIVMLQAWVFDTPKDAAEAGRALTDALKKQHGEAWQATDWQATAPHLGAPFQTNTLSYTGRQGPGRIAIRHDQVLVLDGAPKESFETAWTWALKTRFLDDARDTWSSKSEGTK